MSQHILIIVIKYLFCMLICRPWPITSQCRHPEMAAWCCLLPLIWLALLHGIRILAILLMVSYFSLWTLATSVNIYNSKCVLIHLLISEGQEECTEEEKKILHTITVDIKKFACFRCLITDSNYNWYKQSYKNEYKQQLNNIKSIHCKNHVTN